MAEIDVYNYRNSHSGSSSDRNSLASNEGKNSFGRLQSASRPGSDGVMGLIFHLIYQDCSSVIADSQAVNDEIMEHFNSGGRMPTYLLEHLATFTVSPENDLVYPADGMRRLLAMEKTSGIWTQKVFCLCFARNCFNS